MNEDTIRILLFSVICFAAGFELALILTFGSIRKWKACGDVYQSGRVAVLHELYDRIAERQKKAKGEAWSILNEILDLIAGMLPKNTKGNTEETKNEH